MVNRGYAPVVANFTVPTKYSVIVTVAVHISVHQTNKILITR